MRDRSISMKQREALALNRLKTLGRPKGSLNKNTTEIKHLAMMAAPDAIRYLIGLAKNARNESVRVAAIKELLDRAIGRPVQPHSGEIGTGTAIVQVITGVPRLDPDLPG
ncbi:MAG: hypothetical protein ACREBU_01785 [Nitrososphaera sp.]